MRIAIIIYDDFTDIDLFLSWDLLGRKEFDWTVKILGSHSHHTSSNGLKIATHGHLEDAINFDVVIFCSGKGSRKVIEDDKLLSRIKVDPSKQLVCSICTGSLILATLGLLKGLDATTYITGQDLLHSMRVNVVNKPFVSTGNIATAGGCLSSIYLCAWIVKKLYNNNKCSEVLRKILPVGQEALYEELILSSINDENSDL